MCIILFMSKVYIALDHIRSLYNVGSIMRTADFLSYSEIILIGYSGIDFDMKGKKVLHPKLEKTALGAEKRVNTTFIENAEELLFFARENNLKIISVEQSSSSVLLGDWVLPEKDFIIVFGHETKGVSKEVLKISDEVVEIERLGKKHSLNVATSAGIVLFEVAQFNKKGN